MLSVLNQTYPNIEYIIIDGGSTDGTVDIIKKYSDRLAYWVSEPDKGIYDAMNKGINAATGDYINFLNAGDIYYSRSIVSQIISLIPSSDVIYGDIIINTSVGIFYYYPTDLEEFSTKMPIYHPSTIVSLRKIKQFLFNTEYSISGDYDQMYRMYNSGCTFQYIPMPFVIFDGIAGISSNYVGKAFYENSKINGSYSLTRNYRYNANRKFKDFIYNIVKSLSNALYIKLKRRNILRQSNVKAFDSLI